MFVPGYRVSRLEPVDIDAVQSLLIRCEDYFQLISGALPTPDEARQTWVDVPPGKTTADKFLFGLWADNTLIGLLDAIRDYPQSGIWFVGLLLIDPAWRGHGLGDSWYRAFEDWAARSGASCIMLGVVEQNEKAFRFWQRLGFEVVEKRSPTRFGQKEQTVVVMRGEAHMEPIQMASADIGGTQFYYETSGSGHPLLFIHAGIADSRMWDEQFEFFALHFRVIRYDLRGFGKTPMVAGSFSHVQDLYELVKYLGIEKVCLIGCSIGGRTALDFTLEHPDRVSGLVLVASALSGYRYAGDPPKQYAEIEEADQRGDWARVNELELQVWVDGPQRTPDQVDQQVRGKVREMNAIALSTPSDLGQEQRSEPGAAGRLAEVHVPTLVIVGDLDQPDVQSVADTLAREIVGAHKVIMQGTAHVPNMEQPDEFNRVVFDFLNKAIPEV